MSFLEKFENIRFETSDDFETDILDETVYIGLNPIATDLKAYHRKIIPNNIGTRFYALLHEIGHIKSLELFSKKYQKKLLKDYDIEYSLIQELYANELLDFEEFFSEYKKLNLEKGADEWALEYIRQNKNIQNEQKEFYEMLEKI